MEGLKSGELRPIRKPARLSVHVVRRRRMFMIADGVVQYCKETLSSSDPANTTIRLSESRGCCFAYFSFDKTEQGEEGDILIEADEVKFFVEPTVFEGFSEAILDYIDGSLTISGQGRPVYSAPLITNIRGGQTCSQLPKKQPS
jgi:Fe-S cluster assembly iron-binding protein IscA